MFPFPSQAMGAFAVPGIRFHRGRGAIGRSPGVAGTAADDQGKHLSPLASKVVEGYGSPFRVDSKIGRIPADKLDMLFRPFIQLDGSITRKFGGTGLGLAITSRLIKIMNGKITVKSELNKGSCFSILFREVEIASTDSIDPGHVKQIDPVSVKFKKSSVLVADDICFE